MTDTELTQELQRIREMLQSADKHTEGSFSKVTEAFLDLMHAPGFLARGEWVEDEILTSMLHAYAQSRTNNAGAKAAEIITVKLMPHELCHGAFRLGELQANYFWFGDIGQGIVVLMHKAGEYELARLTKRDVDPAIFGHAKVLRGVEGLH